MSFPVSGTPHPAGSANPNPAYTGIFIPEIWSGKLIEKFYDATVLAAISNTEYEGEISNQGDKVNIRTRPTITIKTYEAEQALDVERPSSNLVELLIDQGRYWNTILDDVMETQADLDMLSMWADDASEQMKINIDSYVLDHIDADVVAANKGANAGRLSGDINLGATTAPRAVSPADILDFIVDCSIVLDEQNIPESGRWMVIPAWMAGMIKKSDLRDASLAGDGTSIMRNGRLGMIDRFTLYMSNLSRRDNDPAASTTLANGEQHVLAGHSHGLTFASQLSKLETLRSESTFGTLMRGLQVFGHKVIDGTAIVSAVTSKAP